MSAYVPEFVYGFTGWDEYNQPTHGLVEWPEHLKPREPSPDIALTKKGEAYVAAALAEADGVFFLTLDVNDRQSIATSIEKLINMLDDLAADPDLEPDEGAEPSLGWTGNGPQSQNDSSDREEECEDEGAQCDDEGAMDSDREYSLGWTEGIDQETSGKIVDGIQCREDSEPDLGWAESHGRGIWGEQNCLDDREADDSDREKNGDEEDLDGGQYDPPIFTPGGGSVSQTEDGWKPARGPSRPAVYVEQAEVLPNGDIAREIIAKRDRARKGKTEDRRATRHAPVSIGHLPKDTVREIRLKGALSAKDFWKLPWA